MRTYKRIKIEDRERILVLRQKGLTQTQIAHKIGKNQSAISRELAKGNDNSIYNPILAQRITTKRAKSRAPSLKINEATWRVITNHLALHWSPRQIENYLHNVIHGSKVVPVSEKTIYNYINFHMKGELKKLALAELRQKGKPRKKRPETRGKIPNMTLIDDRPKAVDSRDIPGHWEGDLIIGADHKSALSVIVERKTRFVMMDRLLAYDAETVRKSIEKRFRKMDRSLVKSLTCDQGKEMAQHEILSSKIKLKIYFCHPHSPWEKGTCENTNFLIRDMLHGITDFRKLTQSQVTRVARLLNERPRETLGFKTPKEKIIELCAKSY